MRGDAGKRGDRTIRVTLGLGGGVEGGVGERASAVLLEIVEGREGYEGGLSVSVVVRHAGSWTSPL
jgi:hypothetical protein